MFRAALLEKSILHLYHLCLLSLFLFLLIHYLIHNWYYIIVRSVLPSPLDFDSNFVKMNRHILQHFATRHLSLTIHPIPVPFRTLFYPTSHLFKNSLLLHPSFNHIPTFRYFSTHRITQSTPNILHSTSRDKYNERVRQGNQRIMLYTASIIVTFIGLSYCAVPMYELICTQTGINGMYP